MGGGKLVECHIYIGKDDDSDMTMEDLNRLNDAVIDLVVGFNMHIGSTFKLVDEDGED